MVKNRIIITKETGITPAEYESWPYYEYEYLLDDLHEYAEERRKQEESESSKYNTDSFKHSMDSSIKSMTQKMQIPKTPKF